MKSLLASTLFAATVMFGSAANAAPLSPASSAPAGVESQVEKVHGYHRSCKRGPARWHRHTRSDHNVRCGPRRDVRVYTPSVGVYIGPSRKHYRADRRHDRRHN